MSEPKRKAKAKPVATELATKPDVATNCNSFAHGPDSGTCHEDDHARRARLNHERVLREMECGECGTQRQNHGPNATCSEFVEPDTWLRWAHSRCACGRSRECNGVGVKACPKCEPGVGYVFRGDSRGRRHEPKVEVTGLDLNRYALDHILPGAAEMCEEGQRREIIAERDGVKEANKVVWFVETRPGHFATTGRLMLGMPPLEWTGRASEAHWQYCLHLQKCRVARGEDARKIARTTVFMQAGKGAQG